MKNITTHTPDTGTASAKFFAGEQKRGTLAGAAACNPTAAVRELGPLAVILAGCGGPAPAQSVATSQGTPGPWKAENGFGGRVCIFSSYANDGRDALHVATCGPDNARLIAAAPELLDALQALLAVTEEPALDELDNRQGMARAAIAKATGGAK